MPIKSRENLKALFKNGCIPTADNFADLIDSALNKREDHFFGFWKPGERYCNGDIVIYGKALYMLRLNDEDPCTDDKPENCICSKEPPEGNPDWCLLELEINDEDWEVLPPEGDRTYPIMYSKVWGRIGMGTQNPETRVDILGEGKGQFLFDPDGKRAPTFVIRNLRNECDANYLWNRLEEDNACWITDAPLGYKFKMFEPQSGTVMPTDDSTTHLLMFVTSKGPNYDPCVGIGTDDPKAALDVRHEKGQVLVKTAPVEGPEIVMVAWDTKNDPSFFAVNVNDAWAALVSDSAKGFQFRRSEAYKPDGDKDTRHSGDPLMTIRETGKVGIGTEDPKAMLQVTDCETGSFCMSMKYPAPAFSIANLKPDETQNYLAMGADNDQSVFVTDAPEGYVFRKGEPADEEPENAERLDQGTDLVTIDCKGKVGIGKPTYEDYQLDVNGDTRSFGFYEVADKEKIKDNKYVKYPLDGLMDDICSLNAYLFNWDLNKTKCADADEQIGMKASEVEECFRQVVKGKPGEKAIAYQNLVPILIEAVKNLHARVCELEEKDNTGD